MKSSTIRNAKGIVSSFMLILFLTACEKDDVSLKAVDDLKSTTIKEFMNVLRSADPKNRVALIEDFESRNNIDLNDSINVIRPIVLKNSGVETEIEYVGPQSQDLDALSGYINQNISWVVIRNLFNWWEVKSHDVVTHDGMQIFEVYHLYSGLEGLTFDMIDWEEKYNETQHWQTAAIIKVEGYLTVTGIGDSWVSNYCTAQIPAVEDPSDSSGVIIIN